MKKLDVYDPPMCCSTGVCGPNVDPVLPRFAGDLEWLKGQGVNVVRNNLAQQPLAFAENATVRDALEREDVACLPMILADGAVVSKGRYPTRGELARFAGIEVPGDAGKEPTCCCCRTTMGASQENCCR